MGFPKFNSDFKKAGLNEADALSVIQEYVRNNLGADLRLKTVGLLFRISPTTIKRIFHKESTISFYHFIMEERIKRAHELITVEGKFVSEAMELTGFRSRPAFTRAFKKKYEALPGKSKRLKRAD